MIAMKQNIKLYVTFSCVAVASFIAGFLLAAPIVSHELAAGDISRAKIFTKSVVNVNTDNVQERLLADSLYCAAANSRAQILKTHAHQLADLIENTDKTFGGDECFADAVQKINSTKSAEFNLTVQQHYRM